MSICMCEVFYVNLPSSFCSHENLAYQCGECSVSFDRPSALQLHVQQYHSAYHCGLCAATCESLAELKQHVQGYINVHTVPYILTRHMFCRNVLMRTTNYKNVGTASKDLFFQMISNNTLVLNVIQASVFSVDNAVKASHPCLLSPYTFNPTVPQGRLSNVSIVIEYITNH